MNKLKKQVNAFLKKYKMHYESIDFEKECASFIKEMEKGLKGESSSLKMLCTYISPEGNIPVNEPVIVIDAGGTNLRVAVAYFNNEKQAILEELNSYPMPGVVGEVSRDEFFNTIAEYLKPVIDKSDRIGFCFSYPTEMLPNGDGKLIQFNKEVKVREMINVEIGAYLAKTLKSNLITKEKKIVLLNDTAATLLGGKASVPDRHFDSYIGFILGTGTNTCFIEENKDIPRAPSLPSNGYTIINIESGGYEKAPRGTIDRKFDNSTADPGKQQFEKMISGAYQGNLILEIIRKAAGDNLFSKGFGEKIRSVNNLSSREIDDFCLNPYSEENVLSRTNNTQYPANDADRMIIYYIIDAFFERAAKLVAINLASIMIKTGKGKNPCLPVCIAAEGTTFFKSKFFKGKLEYYIKKYLNDKIGIYCELIKTENATLIGTAFAGLLNEGILKSA